jgi:NADPH-dependent curcumin reductase CurA
MGMVPHEMILMQRLRVEGFIVVDFAERYPEAVTALGQWMAEGKITVRTEIVEGLENALQTLKKLFSGANTGKLLIRVKDA